MSRRLAVTGGPRGPEYASGAPRVKYGARRLLWRGARGARGVSGPPRGATLRAEVERRVLPGGSTRSGRWPTFLLSFRRRRPKLSRQEGSGLQAEIEARLAASEPDV